MKKILFAVMSIIVGMAALQCIGACGNGDLVVYELSLSATSYTVNQGEDFTVPIPTVKPELPQGSNIVWSVKFGGEEVEKTTDGAGFTAQKEGVYTVNYLLSDKTSKPLIITVTSEKVLLDTAAPTDVAIDVNGIITFNAVNNREYLLFIDGENKGNVVNNANIKNILPAGEYEVAVAVKKDAVSKQSPLSVPVSVSRCGKVEISLQGVNVVFTESESLTYGLYNSGSFKGNVTSGQDVSGYISDGTNEFYIIVSAVGSIESEKSNVLSKTSHPKITDFSLSADYKAEFSYRQGFKYYLYADDAPLGEITSGSEASDMLENLSSGAHSFAVNVVSDSENSVVRESNKTSNALDFTKLSAPTNISVQDEMLTFDAESDAKVHLFIDGNDKGEVLSGVSIITYYTSNDDMTVALKSVKDGFLASSFSTEKLITVPEKYKVLQKEVLYNQKYFYSDETFSMGARVSAAAGEEILADAVIPFNGDLTTIAYCNQSGNYKISRFTIKMTDVTTNSVLAVALKLDSDIMAQEAVYMNVVLDGVELKTNEWLFVGLADVGINVRTLTFFYKNGSFGTSAASMNGNTGLWNTQITQSELGDFGKDGIKMSFTVDAVVNEENADFIIESIGNFNYKALYEIEKNATHTYSDETNITGTKYSVYQTDSVVNIKKGVDFSGNIMTFGLCSLNGKYAIKDFSVLITDATLNKTLELKYIINETSLYFGGVIAGWTYNDETKIVNDIALGINMADNSTGQYSANCPRILTLSVGTNGNSKPSVLFSNCFLGNAWKMYFEGTNALDLTGFGTNKVDVSIKVNAFNNATSGSFVIA